MRYIRCNGYPGDSRLMLTDEWMELPAGTIVQPRSFGMGFVDGELVPCRRVIVISGEHAGKIVVGPW